MKKFLSFLIASLIVTACNRPGTGPGEAVSIPLKPIAQVYSASEDQSWEGQLAVEDAMIPVEYEIIESPTKGDIGNFNRATGEFTYLPHPNQYGEDSFKYRASNSLQEGSAKVTVMITEVNDAPVSQFKEIKVTEDTNVSYKLTATDMENDPVTFALVSNASKGNVTINANGDLTFTPKANSFGDDLFVFSVSDGKLTTKQNVVVVIVPVNDAPVVLPLVMETMQGIKVESKLVASDVENDTLTFKILTQGTKGEASVNANTGAVFYTPAAGKSGPDSFQVIVNDGKVDSQAATVSVVINVPANSTPVAKDGTVSGTEDLVLNGTMQGTDADQDALTFNVTKMPKGKLKFEAKTGNFTYTPPNDFHGEDNFAFTASDGKAVSSPASVLLKIAPVNDVPLATLVGFLATEDKEESQPLSGSDADGDALKFNILRGPKNGTLRTVSADGRDIVYKPNLNFHGEDSFIYTVSDATTSSLERLVSIQVVSVPDAPLAQDDSAEVFEMTEKTIQVLSNDSDADGDKIALNMIKVAPKLGSAKVSQDGQQIIYKAPLMEKEAASDALEYEIIDATGAKATAKLNISLKTYSKTYTLAVPSTLFNSNNVSVVQRENGISMSGDRAAIGFYRAQRKLVNGEYQIGYLPGRIFAYAFNQTAWLPLQTIESPNGNSALDSDDGFGDRIVLTEKRLITTSLMPNHFAAVHCYELIDGKYQLIQSIPVNSSNVYLAADGDRLLVGSGTSLTFFKAVSKGYDKSDSIDVGQSIRSLSISESLIAIGSDIPVVPVYEIKEGKLYSRYQVFAPGLPGVSYGREVALRGKRLLVSAHEYAAALYELKNGKFEIVDMQWIQNINHDERNATPVHVALMDNHIVVAPNESLANAQSIKAVRYKKFASQNNRFLRMDEVGGFALSATADRVMVQTAKTSSASNPYGVKIIHYLSN